MYSKNIVGLGGVKSKDIEKAKKEYYSIIKYLNKRKIPFTVKEVNKGRKIPIHQREIKIVGKPNVRMIDILQIMKSEKTIGVGAVQDKWSVVGFFKDKELAQNRLKKEIASQKRMVKEFPNLKKYIRVFKIEKKEGDVYVIFSKKPINK